MESKQAALCIGASGFWGQHVCAALKGRLRLLQTTSRASVATHEGWIHLDVVRPDTLSNLPKQVDVIILLVMSPHYKQFPEHAIDVWQAHVQGLLLLLEYARRANVKHFVLASTGSVYAPSMTSLSEDSPLATDSNSSFYAHSKIAAEMLLNSYAQFFSTTALRLFIPYGRGAATGMLMSFLTDAIIDGRTVYLQGEDGMMCTPTHISDAAQAVVQSLTLQGHHTINVAGCETVSIGQICRIIGETCGRAPIFEYKEEGSHLVADTRTQYTLLGSPRMSLTAGIADFVAWRQSLLSL